MSDVVMKVEVADGKYTVIQEANGTLSALRNGEHWLELSGNKLVLALAQELQNARDKIKEMEDDARNNGIERDLQS